MPENKILKTKQARPQRRLLGGESAVEGDRIFSLESHWQPLEQVRYKVAFLVSSVTAVIRRPSSCTSFSPVLGYYSRYQLSLWQLCEDVAVGQLSVFVIIMFCNLKLCFFLFTIH